MDRKRSSRPIQKRSEAFARSKGTLWILDKGDVDQLDRNKVPVLFGLADCCFLNSRSASTISQVQD
jgi:hypothetical protein